jgi:hypothetical protein
LDHRHHRIHLGYLIDLHLLLLAALSPLID